MDYDFSTMLDRRGRDSITADMTGGEGAHVPRGETRPGFTRIPMWVADMSFPTAPSIIDALVERAKHPAFGYFMPSEAYYDAIVNWRREGGAPELTREAVGYENGVLGGVTSALRVLCSDGDGVLLHSPVYNGFLGVLKRNGFRPVLSPLRLDENGVWRMDFEDMDRRLRQEHVHTAIFCSPHNPCGRVWERWEIEAAMEVYRANDVYVISDEIWSDLTLFGHRHIPTQSVSEDAKWRTAAFYAPSKTFNLAGLVGSYHIIYDPWLRDRITQYEALCHYNDMNVLSMHALIGAYTPEGRAWLEELREVLGRNVTYAADFIRMHFPGVQAARPEGTYLLLLDCETWCRRHDRGIEELQRAGVAAGVIWQDGRLFDAPWGIRMNLALPEAQVAEAFDRLERYVFRD